LYKENKTLFFIEHYFKNMIESLSPYIGVLNKNISFPINNIMEKSLYYFDSIIATFSTIIESEQKNVLYQYLDEEKVNKFFPSRNELGLFWEIFMLRNRILHFTEARFDYSKKECIRYQDFSSKFNMVNIDKNENMHMYSTLIDINKSTYVKQIINKCIKDKDRRDNPFDLLFPNVKAKGYGKKAPFLSAITNDIWFDHVDSSIILISKIQDFFQELNKCFLDSFLIDCHEKDTVLSCKTGIYLDGECETFSIKEVFDTK
jgi:hypothetical protein